jgi:uncharacterized delta-60 repeat protein
MHALEARMLLSAGDLDESFGRDGVLVEPALNDARAGLAVQADGKILLTDGTRIFRRNPDGSPDTSFGAGGAATPGVTVLGFAPAAGGKILVGGRTAAGVTAARLLPNGSIDPTYQPAVTTGLRGAQRAGVDAQGRVVVGGTNLVSGDDPADPTDDDDPEYFEAVAVRFNANGSLDTDYGTNGVASGGTLNGFRTMAVAPNGSVVIAGQLTIGPSDNDEVYALFDPNGDLAAKRDGGGGGSFTFNEFIAAAFRPDNTLLLGDSDMGSSNLVIGPDPNPKSVRVFFAPTDRNSEVDAKINAITATPDGKILLGGFAGSQNPGLGLIRLNPDGSDDDTFAFGGRESFDINRRKLEWITDLAVTPDGDVLAAGRVGGTDKTFPYEGNFFLARFEGGAHPVGDQAPRAAGDPRAPRIGQPDYTFNVIYAAEESIDLTTLGNRDVRVLGPRGYSALARLVETEQRDDGGATVATYQIPAPNGEWGRAANGNYTIYVRPDQVLDNRGNAVPAGNAGEFDVYFARSRRRRAAAPAVLRDLSPPDTANPFATTSAPDTQRRDDHLLRDATRPVFAC